MSGYGPQQGELELLTAKNNVLRHHNHVGNGRGPYAVPKEGEKERETIILTVTSHYC